MLNIADLNSFCGCGTAVHAAQKLNRQWIGIAITHLAISLLEKRLKDAFGAGRADLPVSQGEGEAAQQRRPTNKLEYVVHGTPKNLDAARDLATRDKYQFQWWAVSLVEAQPFQGRKKGADGGIDGLKFFGDIPLTPSLSPSDGERVAKPGEGTRASVHKIVVSVKGGGLKADDMRALNYVREREGADIAIFISLEEPTRGMVKDAASAGFYESPNGKNFPRVQLLTIEGLLNKSQRAEHPDYEPDLNFKKAKAEAHGQQKELI